MKKFEFNQAVFYRIGKYCFFGSGSVGVIRIIDTFKTSASYDIVGQIFSTIFQFGLFGLFAYMSKKETIREVTDTDIIEMEKILKDNLK